MPTDSTPNDSSDDLINDSGRNPPTALGQRSTKWDEFESPVGTSRRRGAVADSGEHAQVGDKKPKARKNTRGNDRNRLIGSDGQLAVISKPVFKHLKTHKRERASTSHDQDSRIEAGEVRSSAGADSHQKSGTSSSNSYTSGVEASSACSDTSVSPPPPQVFLIEARLEPKPGFNVQVSRLRRVH
ncbi:hypothetical protein L596_004617 [Steinernema carpocapsae]|uniref:Uncharacterized protein n=1 Tax=Steinernema carpocapsae TaxID=34508 RepID=A0A4U8UXV3_STECR|nr:hypothetical protein L596_004617 [Steinernema carpocapsae]